MKAYFISGLGTDRRIFQKLKLNDDIRVSHIDWILPARKETFQDYCRRLGSCIDTSERFSLVGLSFGGVAAIEISRFIKPERLIIISSVATSNEIPLPYRVGGELGLDKIIPSSIFNKPTIITNWLFGARTKEEKELLASIIKDTEPWFDRWSVTQLLNWTNKDRPSNLFHIHGTADRLLPHRNVRPDISIQGGGHLMIYNMAEQVSKILNECLSRQPL